MVDLSSLGPAKHLIMASEGLEGGASRTSWPPAGSLDQENVFRYSSLEADPEKEFKDAKWVVLTTPQPSFDEESATEKKKVDKQGSFALEKTLSGVGTSGMLQNNMPSG